jgi:hypothetical protein
MLLRHWLRPTPRPAGDLDLVASYPFDIDDVGRRFLPLFADEIGDGVTFDLERLRVEGIWLGTGNPGVRVFASGWFDGAEDDFNVDITFAPQPRPAAVFGELPTACEETARVRMCRPETIVGQKVQALRHLGMLGWRSKDLDDLRLLLARVPMNDAALREAVTAYMADVGGTPSDAVALFGPESWWGMKLSAARWLDHAKASPGRDVPKKLADVVAGIAGRLGPVLEGSR